MNLVKHIAIREWRAIMLSPAGLVVALLYLLLAGYLFSYIVTSTQVATISHTLQMLGGLAIFIVPLITMRLLSEELRTGTFEVLIAHPVTDMQIILGKFLAGVMVFLAISAPTLLYMIILQMFGSPDWGPAVSGYLGQWLLATMLIALGLLISATTQSQVLAAMGALVGGLLLSMASTARYSAPGWTGEALAYLAVFEHFHTFARGVVDSRSLIYFVATTVMLLYLAVRAVESRRWKFGMAPGNVPRQWNRPLLSIALAILGLLFVANAAITRITGGVTTGFGFFTIILGLGLLALPAFLNRMRLRYELSRRQTGLALTVMVNSLLVIMVWALVLYLTSFFFARFDLTSTKRYALSEQTVMTLNQLPVQVEVVVALPQDLGPQRRDAMDLMAEYTARSPRITLSQLDPIRSPTEAERWRERLQLGTPIMNELLVVVGDQYRRIPVQSLYREEFHVIEGRRVRSNRPGPFQGEAEVTSAMLQLTREEPGRIVFLSGHGERDIDSRDHEGASLVATELRRLGWVVEKRVITPGQQAAIPPDTAVVVIAGPRRPMSDEVLREVQAVLDRGGGVLTLIDPGPESGLEPLIYPWNVRIAKNMVVDQESHVATLDPLALYVQRFQVNHPIGRGMGNLAVVMPTARRVAVAEFDPNPAVVTTNFMHTSGRSWAMDMTDRATDVPLRFDAQRDRRGPVSLGIACERWQENPQHGGEPLQGRLVVIGNSVWMTNQYVDNVGNMDLFLNCVEWLAGRHDLISVRPKIADLRLMTLTPRQATSIFWISVLILPGVAAILGVYGIVQRSRG